MVVNGLGTGTLLWAVVAATSYSSLTNPLLLVMRSLRRVVKAT